MAGVLGGLGVSFKAVKAARMIARARDKISPAPTLHFKSSARRNTRFHALAHWISADVRDEHIPTAPERRSCQERVEFS
jgi:hypothetical protein